MRSKNPGRSKARQKTNLFDDPERDDDFVKWSDDELRGRVEPDEDDWDEGPTDVACERCDGTGLIEFPDERLTDECPQCQGTGYLLESI